MTPRFPLILSPRIDRDSPSLPGPAGGFLRAAALTFLLGGLAAGLRAAEDAPEPMTAKAGAGFEPLFDGSSFAGWKVSDAAKLVWSVRDGRISAENVVAGGRGVKEPDIWTEKSYRDFELIVDWRLPQQPRMRMLPAFTPDGLFLRDEKGGVVRHEVLDGGDSGVYLRGTLRNQVNIWSQPMGSGDINEVHKDASVPADIRRALVPKMKADAPLGQWNRFVITLRGDRVTVVLNGHTVIDHAQLPGIPAEGPIGLQHEYRGSEAEFANLYVKELN